MIRKEFIEIRRDHRTLALIIAVPVILLIIFGYAANFQVRHIAAEIVGVDAPLLRSALAADGGFTVRAGVAADQAAAESDIQHGKVAVAVVPGSGNQPARVLIDGSNLLTAMTAERERATLLRQSAGTAPVSVDVLYNPSFSSATFMIPGLIGTIMTQVALVLTALGVVRERERGTIEQLMVTPIRKLELMLGKTIPYLVIGLCDLVIVLAVSRLLLLSGLIFPLAAMAWGVRWVSYLLPLTYFVSIARGVLLKSTELIDLWPQTAGLAILAVAYVGLAALRFPKTLD